MDSNRDVEKGSTNPDEITVDNESGSQKAGPARRLKGRFRSDSTSSIRTKKIDFSKDNEDGLNPITLKDLVKMVFLYMLPLGACIAIPIILAAVYDPATNSSIGGVPLLQFFIWVEISWVSLWTSKLIAKVLPFVVRPLVSSGVRKYCRQLQELEIPLALVGGTFAMYISFYPMMHREKTRNEYKQKDQQPWETVVQEALAATLCSSLVYLGKCVLITIVRVRYHQTQFASRIKENKANIRRLIRLMGASRKAIPDFAALKDYDDFLINPAEEKISALVTDVRFVLTNKEHDPNHPIVVQALEKVPTSEALARRIWSSLIRDPESTALYKEDLIRHLKPGHPKNSPDPEIDQLFAVLDMDENGDVSEEEAVGAVLEIQRERADLVRGTTDIKSSVDAFDWLLLFACLILMVFVYIAFLTNQIKNTFAFAGTLLAGSAFAFSGTIQDLMASIILVFVKHPYDVGDRIDFDGQEYIVHDISLLYTVFLNMRNNKLVHIGNTFMAGKAIENITRSGNLKETIRLSVSFSTSFEDVEYLKEQMMVFVKENSREYFMDSLDARIFSFGLDKLELQVDVKYKGSWANQTLHAERREKFQRQLISVLRKIPVYGPGSSGDPGLGTAGNAAYSVNISAADAEQRHQAALHDVAAKRWNPPASSTGAEISR